MIPGRLVEDTACFKAMIMRSTVEIEQENPCRCNSTASLSLPIRGIPPSPFGQQQQVLWSRWAG